MMTEWNIQMRGHACQACAGSFASGQSYHTVLFDRKPGYERLDVCESCWGAQYGQGATSRKGFISHWQGVFELPPVQPDPIKRETAETLLRKLVELNDPRHGAACFILAVMLERKRLLKVRDQTRQDGHRVFIYEQPATGDSFTILDPDLQLNQLDEVQRTVSQLLEEGLPSTPESPPGIPDAPGNEDPAPQLVTESAANPAQTVVC